MLEQVWNAKEVSNTTSGTERIQFLTLLKYN